MLSIHWHSAYYGRVIAADVKDPVTGELLCKQGDVITRDDIERLADSAVSKVYGSFST